MLDSRCHSVQARSTVHLRRRDTQRTGYWPGCFRGYIPMRRSFVQIDSLLVKGLVQLNQGRNTRCRARKVELRILQSSSFENKARSVKTGRNLWANALAMNLPLLGELKNKTLVTRRSPGVGGVGVRDLHLRDELRRVESLSDPQEHAFFASYTFG